MLPELTDRRCVARWTETASPSAHALSSSDTYDIGLAVLRADVGGVIRPLPKVEQLATTEIDCIIFYNIIRITKRDVARIIDGTIIVIMEVYN